MKWYVIIVEQYEEIIYKCLGSENYTPGLKSFLKARENLQFLL